MTRLSPERLAQGSIGVLFLALLRTLGEYYRLRAGLGREQGLRAFDPFIPGLLLAVAGTAVAVVLYFSGRLRLVVWAAGLTVLALLVYKAMFIPWGGYLAAQRGLHTLSKAAGGPLCN